MRTVNVSTKEKTINPNPTLFRTREASKPYSRGQWDTALKATPHSPKGDVSYVRALEQTVCSDAHGFRSRRPRSLLTVLNFCRIRVSSLLKKAQRGGVILRSREGQEFILAPISDFNREIELTRQNKSLMKLLDSRG